MNELETKKLAAVREETRRRGRKLTSIETLRVERRVAEEHARGKGGSDDDRPGQLPLSMYRFD